MIKVLIPDMPTVEELLPYLKLIDTARWYANHGPMVQLLEARLTQMVGVPCAVVSTGTAALELALKATAHVNKIHGSSEIIIPSVTFSATCLAAMNASDFDNEEGWPITIVDVNDNGQMPIPVSARLPYISVPVAAFGKPIDIEPWEAHAQQTNTPVVIDAAGAFGEQKVSTHPLVTTCFSFHSTKIVGAGEGGCVFSSDAALLDKVCDLRNFDDDGGTNAKMSEYHAAVCHASLDRLPDKIAKLNIVNQHYERYLPKGVQASISSTMLNIFVDGRAYELATKLEAEDVQTKQWYRPYLHEREAFHSFCGGRMTMSENFAASTLGLPYHSFLSRLDIRYICETLQEAL